MGGPVGSIGVPFDDIPAVVVPDAFCSLSSLAPKRDVTPRTAAKAAVAAAVACASAPENVGRVSNKPGPDADETGLT